VALRLRLYTARNPSDGVNQSVTRFLLCASLAVIGAIATQLSATRYLPLVDRLQWESWDELVLLGAIGGALLGNLYWVAMKPSERVTRAIVLCVLAHVLVWISFLIFNPPLTEAEFADIDASRKALSTDNGFDLLTDQPFVVAGRWSGTYGAVNDADGTFAMDSMGAPGMVITPASHTGGDSTLMGKETVFGDVKRRLTREDWNVVNRVNGSPFSGKNQAGKSIVYPPN
jgi:hypothetical protein